MGIFSFFKRPVHQKFDYKPRFYDAEREEREARWARYDDKERTSDQLKSRISAGFRSKSSGSSIRANRRANIRLVIILVVLVVMTFIFLERYLPIIVEAVE